MRRGAFPGSFNPPTVAHVALAAAARGRHRLDRVDLVVSRIALTKEHVEVPTFEDRVAVLERLCGRIGWLGVVVSDHQLVVDLVDGYDVVVMGADKWAQVNDESFYASAHQRDAALRRLPEVAVAPRPPHDAPPDLLLHVDAVALGVSSTAARNGWVDIMVPEARTFDRDTGAWTDPGRYRRGRSSGGGVDGEP